MMKKNVKHLLGLMLVGSLVVGSLTACSGGNKETEKKEKAAEGGKVVTVAIPAEPDNLDVAKNMDDVKAQITMHVQETLVGLDEKGAIIEAGAESYEISEDGLTYTFKLRENKYSDGTVVKSEDYANGLLRTLDPTTASQYAFFFYPIKGGEEFSTEIGKKEDVAITCPDEKTLVITLKERVPYFIQMFTHSSTTPIPTEMTTGEKNISYGSDKEGMKYSGPFVIAEWKRGTGLTLEKNPEFWGAKDVKLDTINMQLAADINTRQQLFEQGQIGVLEQANKEYIEKRKGDIDSKKISNIEVANPSYMYVLFNNQDESGIFANAKIRKAFSTAIDREIFVEKVLQANVPAYGIIPPSSSIGDENFREVVEEPFLADAKEDPKKLFEEGLKEIGKEGEKIEVTFLQKNAENESKVQAEFFQNQWQEKLGVTVKIDTAADSATFNTTVQNGQYQICITGWGGDYNDPMTFMGQFITAGNNPAFCSNARYDELIKESMTEMDMKKRCESFAEAEKIAVSDEAFIAPLYYKVKNNLINEQLKGVTFDLNNPVNLRNASVK